MLSNLITNAIDFVAQDVGRIEVGLLESENEITFYVRDNGVGIAPEKQKQLFTKFYQVDTTLTRKHGGSGLGLAICKGIVESFGGKIWMESQQGKGATFYFTVPKHEPKNRLRKEEQLH